MTEKNHQKQKQQPRRWFTPQQTGIFLDTPLGHPFEGFFALAVTYGLRRGELIALRWEDVDLEQRTLQVQRMMIQIPGRGLVFSPLKTQASRRTIILPPCIAELLQQRLGYREAAREDLVFVPEPGVGVLSPQFVSQQLRTLMAQAGLPFVPFHALRPSATVLLLALGISPQVVAATLGVLDRSSLSPLSAEGLHVAQQRGAERIEAWMHQQRKGQA